MQNFTVTSANRGAAKRILSVWYKSKEVRLWPLDRLERELRKAINGQLISIESVQRALAKASTLVQPLEVENAENASAPTGGGDTQPDGADPETENAKPAETESPTPTEDWETQLDNTEADGPGETSNESSDGSDQGQASGNADDAGTDGDSDSDGSAGDEQSTDDGTGEQEADPTAEQGGEQGDGEESDDDESSAPDDSNTSAEPEAEDESTTEESEAEAADDYPPDARDDDGNLYHEKLPLVLSLLKAGLNVSLIGPTGCGKSVLAAQIAHILGRKFTTNGTVFSKYDIIGFIDGGGTYHSTPLYDSYTTGGLHCFDEKDRSAPDAIVTFNGMIDGQKQFAFPNGLQTRHKDFLAVACMNTVGLGATADYTAQKQDASAESRFVYVDMEYDHNIEKRVGPEDIYKRVWAIRKACEALHIGHILPTRAIAQAAAARKLGKVSRRDIDKCILFKALSDDAVTQIHAQMKKDRAAPIKPTMRRTH